MAGNYSILVGTTGAGLFQSPDGGESWSRIRDPFPGESQVRALASDPNSPNVVYAGSNNGIYRSEDSGTSWVKLDSPMDGLNIWSIAIDPLDSDTIFAGTSPPFVFRSRDGGKSWQKLSAAITQECAIGSPRVTAMLVDPVDHNNVWAGVEVDGVRRSKDGGDTWEVVNGGLTDPDIHNLTITVGPPKTLLTICPREVFSSTDDGATWSTVGAGNQVSLPYCRAVAVKADDPQVIYMGNGDSAFGGQGALHRSSDRGTTWEALPLPVKPNGTVWDLATHPSDPDFILASTINGQVFYSADAGDSWAKIGRDFGEVHALAWVSG